MFSDNRKITLNVLLVKWNLTTGLVLRTHNNVFCRWQNGKSVNLHVCCWAGTAENAAINTTANKSWHRWSEAKCLRGPLKTNARHIKTGGGCDRNTYWNKRGQNAWKEPQQRVCACKLVWKHAQACLPQQTRRFPQAKLNFNSSDWLILLWSLNASTGQAYFHALLKTETLTSQCIIHILSSGRLHFFCSFQQSRCFFLLFFSFYAGKVYNEREKLCC